MTLKLSKPSLSMLWAAAVGLVLVGLVAGVGVAAPKPGDVITVRVLRAKVMKAPRYIGAVASTVSRGDKLTVRETRGLWYRVEGAASGWIHKSNVIESAVQLSSKPGGGVGASSDEVELAGRGFTPQVEQQYRANHPELDFSHVDAIEQLDVDPETLVEFVTAGDLGGGR